jgi:hypothetical protein
MQYRSTRASLSSDKISENYGWLLPVVRRASVSTGKYRQASASIGKHRQAPASTEKLRQPSFGKLVGYFHPRNMSFR